MMKVCLIWKGVVEENLGGGKFTATLYNVVENTTKEFATFKFPHLKDEVKEGRVFWWVVTEETESLQFMKNNIGEEEQADALRRASEEAKKWGRLFDE